ncbi:Trigger factor [Alphaproteobacteria bacterium]
MAVNGQVDVPIIAGAQIKIIKNESLSREYKITIPSAEILKKVDEEVALQAGTFKLAGFREGKVPLSIVKRQIGQQVLAKEIDKVIGEVINKIVIENDLSLGNTPSVDVESFQPEGELVCSLKFELLPAVPAMNFTDERLKIDVLELKITEHDMKQAYNSAIKMMTNYVNAGPEHVARVGDAVLIDFTGKINGEEFEGNKASSIKVTIGEGQFIPAFEEKLISLKEGDEKSITVLFPKDYHNQELAEKEVVFDIKVHEVLKPEENVVIDDELVKKFGVENVAVFDEMLKQKIHADFNLISRLRTKKLLFDKMDSLIEMEVPEKMVNADLSAMRNEVNVMKAKSAKLDKTDAEIEQELVNIARRRVKLGLILANIARLNNITVTDTDIEDSKKSELARRPNEAKEVEAFYSNLENTNRIRGAMLEEKVVDFILSKSPTAKIEVTSTEFNEKYAKEVQDLAS